jgi:hypothetical protein
MSDHSKPSNDFTDTERQQLKSDDFAAGKAVVILMLGIFSTGVLIYSVVAYWVIFLSHAS